MDRPLEGRTVLSTRPALEEDPLARALTDAGAHVLYAPLTSFAPPPDLAALHRVLTEQTWDAVLLTSPRAVDAVAPLLPPHMPVVAIAPSTRRHALAAGLAVLDTRDACDGCEMAHAVLERMDVTGKRFLLPTSQLSQAPAAQPLREHGATVEVVVAYQTVQATSLPALVVEALKAHAVDAVVCMSPSAVEALCALVPRERLGCVARVAPGPTTARAWEQEDLPAQAVASSPLPATMVDAVVHALRTQAG